MSSRRYVKRVWRVPKDRGALEYFATLVVKLMVKHGWPARWDFVLNIEGHPDGVALYQVGGDGELPPDMQEAAEIAVRIVARTYRVDVTQTRQFVFLDRAYRVDEGGHFRPIKETIGE